MAASTLAELSFSLHELARYLSKHVVTVRKWFENDREVIRTPRGQQQDQMRIPISHALHRCRQMGIPQELLDAMVQDHELHLQHLRRSTASTASPVSVIAPAPPPVTPALRSKGNARSAKFLKNKKPASKSRTAAGRS